jgi:uncharacterized protein Yka (UPF0111/DUF47 family)
LFKRLLPKSNNFFEYFNRHAELIVAASHEFSLLVMDGANITEQTNKIKGLEVQADAVNHECIEALHKTFITPFDRHDIYHLSYQLDDIVDFINKSSAIILDYKLTVMTPSVKQFANILSQATQELEKVIKGFHAKENIEALRKKFATIKKYENDSDALLRKTLSDLFESEPDVRTIIKWKEVYLHLEDAVNRCENVSNIVEGVILEQS